MSKHKNAFSLVELLISLIIISLIISAFAPVMTKKFSKSLTSAKSNDDSYEGRLLTFGNFFEDGLYNCAQTEDGLFTKCTFTVPDLVTEVNAVLVGGGGGGAGGLNFAETRDKEFVHVLSKNNPKDVYLAVTDYMYNFRIQTFITPGADGGAAVSDATHWSGGGGGASGTILTRPYQIPEEALNGCKRGEYESRPCSFAFSYDLSGFIHPWEAFVYPRPYLVPYFAMTANKPLEGISNATLTASGKGGQGWQQKGNFGGVDCKEGYTWSTMSPYSGKYRSCLNSSTFHQNPGTDGQYADLTPIVEGDDKEWSSTVTYPADPINGKGGHTGFIINGYEYGKGGDGGSAGKWNIAPEKGNDGYAKLLYDEMEPGAAGGGGSGACAARIEKIKVSPKTELKITIGAGGLGGALKENGQNGQDTMIEYGSDFRIVTSGGFGGKTPSGPNIQGEASEKNVCVASKDKLNSNQQQNILFRYPGEQGGAAVFNEELKTAQGGLGGLPGFFEIGGFAYKNGGCGGLYSGICANTKADGLSATYREPDEKTLYKTEKYGTPGSGGGGGGWRFEMDNPQPAGVGGDGLDGYVYLYWRKPGR